MAALAARALGADRCGARPCGDPRGQLARRRRRGPEGLSAAGGAQARKVSREARLVTGRSCAAPPVSAASRSAYQDPLPAGPGALRAPLKT